MRLSRRWPRCWRAGDGSTCWSPRPASTPATPLEDGYRSTSGATRLEINLTGVFLCNQAVAPILKQRGGGSIVNISSMAGKTSWPASAEYSASKSGPDRPDPLGGHGTGALWRHGQRGLSRQHAHRHGASRVAASVGARDGLTGDEWLEPCAPTIARWAAWPSPGKSPASSPFSPRKMPAI